MPDNGIDIVVTSPSGHTSVVVEVKLAGELDAATKQLREYMLGVGAPVGLVVGIEEIRILRDTFLEAPSIRVVGQFPTSMAHNLRTSSDPIEFEEHVQSWLESLRGHDDVADEPLLSALREYVLPAIADGTVSAAGFRARYSQR